MSTDTTSREQLLALVDSLPESLDGVWRADLPKRRQIVGHERIALQLDIGDQIFTLIHDNDPLNAHMMLIECRFGAAPQDREGEVYARLLDLNFQVSSMRVSAFAIDEATGNVIYTYPCDIASTTPQALAELLECIAALAQQWRKTWFLDNAASTVAAVLWPQPDAFA